MECDLFGVGRMGDFLFSVQLTSALKLFHNTRKHYQLLVLSGTCISQGYCCFIEQHMSTDDDSGSKMLLWALITHCMVCPMMAFTFQIILKQ